jgi:hypothetical protein
LIGWRQDPDPLGGRAGPPRAQEVERRERLLPPFIRLAEAAATAGEHDAADGGDQ